MKIVLVVDDDTDIRELIVWKLTQAGYGTLAETDGAAGLVAAAGASPTAFGVRPDLVILDWAMPKMSGIDVCLALKADPATSHLPVIMLTAKAQESQIDRGFAAGADDYIVKPFSPSEMIRRVEVALSRVEART
jgi:two-component system phosphate regulon response regulator PhoB